jgi:hypothetical protein
MRGDAVAEPLPTVPPAPDLDRVAAAFEELRRQHDPKRSAAEQRERETLAAKYPGQFVAYLDAWDGERLTRTVLAAAESLSEFHRRLGEHPEFHAHRTEVVVTQVRDPNDAAILVSSLVFEGE